MGLQAASSMTTQAIFRMVCWFARILRLMNNNPTPTDAPFDGHWWVPDDPSRMVPGRLELDEGVWRLTLLGWLGSWSSERHGDDYSGHVHGKVGAMPMTLIDTVGGGHERFGDRRPHKSALAANTVLTGVFGSVDTTFRSASVRLRYLNEWAHRPPWSRGSTSGPSQSSVTYTDPGRVEAVLPRATATLYRSPSGYFDELVLSRDDLFSHFTMTSDEWIRFDFKEPTDLETIQHDYVRPLLALIELAAADQSAILGFGAVPVGADERDARVTVLSAIERTASKPKDPVDLLFNMRAVAFEDVLPAWWRLHEEMGVVVDLLLQALKPGGHVGSQFFTAVTAVEGYHRRAYDSKMSEEYRERRNRILRALSDEDRKWLKGKLAFAHEPTFAERLDEVVTKAGPLFPNAVGNVSKWAKWVKDARNGIAHRKPSEEDLDAVEWRTMIRVTPTLQWLLSLVLLKDLEIPGDVAAAGVKRHRGFDAATANLRTARPDWFT